MGKAAAVVCSHLDLDSTGGVEVKLTEFTCNQCGATSVSSPGDPEEFIELRFPRAHVFMPEGSSEADAQRDSCLHFCCQLCTRDWLNDRISERPATEPL